MTVGTQSQSFGKLLDYEQFIDHQLQRTRRRIKLTDIATACLTLLVGFLGDPVPRDRVRPRRRHALLAALDRSWSAAWRRRPIFTALRLVLPVVSRINAPVRRQDDRDVRAGVQEQPDQLPGAPPPSRATAEGRDGDPGIAGGHRPDPGRCRLDGQPAADDADDLRPLGRDRRLLHLHARRPAQHHRLGPPRLPRRRQPARPTPSSSTSSRATTPSCPRSWPAMHVNFEVETQGVRPDKVRAPPQRPTAASSSPSRS